MFIRRSFAAAVVIGLMSGSSAFAVKPMTKAQAGQLIPEGQYVMNGKNAKRVATLPVNKKRGRTLKVTNLRPKAAGKKSTFTRSKSPEKSRRPASVTARKYPALNKNVAKKVAKKNSVKSSTSRSPASVKSNKKKLKPMPVKSRSRHSEGARLPDAFDMHSDVNPIRGS
jgi:hypothetical protein